MASTRPCLRAGAIINPNGYCPVCRFWHIVIQFTRPVELLVHTLAKANINRILKKVPTAIGFPILVSSLINAFVAVVPLR